MPRKSIDWDDLLHRTVDLLGPVGSENQTSLSQLAELLKANTNAVTQVSVELRAIGALRVRIVADHGQRAYYTLMADEAEIRRRLKSRGWTVGTEKTYEAARTALAGDNGILAFARRPRRALAGDWSQPSKVVEETPFEQLRPQRKDEPHALIEAAKQYAQRSAFIDEEIERFKAQGLVLDRNVIGGLEPDFLMESVMLVLPYVEQLERANDRLQEYANKTVQPSAEASQLRATVKQLREQNERLIAEKTQAATFINDERTKAREKLQAKEREIERLNGLLLDIQRATGSVKIVGGQAEAAVKDPTAAAR